MPIDLTDRIQLFRQAGQQLADASSPEDVATLLRVWVTYPLPADAEAIPGTTGGEALERYRVTPASPSITALVSTDIPAAETWDHPVTHLDAATVDLRLISFFDWEVSAPRPFQYLRARIIRADDPVLTGRDALLEAADCRVEYLD
ncbi:hypothetical protein OKA04_08925 [Luteolibacter flavescens]|uniref:Uncharacterized protein n=1 Tax=Luteolibacter flavescens TaxID=1859460 RepID=A0ABT3FND4_9BACT|nr:hypothetical protein [Luteolibacter flavescens]MCW1884849.1 hypothetical protein [Luteolibacter flavescens]